MKSKICMNASCGATTTSDWKRGWSLRSGAFADLCYKCGSAFENLVFCDMFHIAESGWRTCSLCSKRLHCGCIASESLLELQDYGGICCSTCAKNSWLHLIKGTGICNGFGSSKLNNFGDQQSNFVENRASDGVDEGKLAELCKLMEANDPKPLPQFQRADRKAFLGKINGDDAVCSIGEGGAGFSTLTQPSKESSNCTTRENDGAILDGEDMQQSLVQPSLHITLEALSAATSYVPPISDGDLEGKGQSKSPPPMQEEQRSRTVLPKPPKTVHSINSERNKGMVHQMRVARPPADGRGKSQLLPRYWPRITDQELQKISGDLNSTVVPLFEKVLSASDAGRIGRLVLPKACAEAYFPVITQSEGLPIRIQDVKGKEWLLQFRFWPNNNSRMYVLEGITPCIQSMQLQAGDTVIFSRIDPGGKLVMGFRKASNNVDLQDPKSSAIPNGSLSWEGPFSGGVENPILKGYSCLFQTMKGGRDPLLNGLSGHLNLGEGDVGCHKSDNHGGKKNEELLQQIMIIPEKKRTRTIGSKSKRLLMHNEDVLELRLTWEEAQDLLRPPPNVKPSIITIDELEFEEYDLPPVFGKRTIFTSQSSGAQEQWAQCDDCSKWRRLPVDILLPPKWTCLDNVWDPNRCSCSVPEEINRKELDILRASKDLKKQRIGESHMIVQEREPSGLDALASAAFLGDNISEAVELPIGATTKHPRHRPGCTCIVCIQPPSGKGKHKPTCTCYVCMTVKRRFKTFMQRKKKRLLEREAEISQEQIHQESQSRIQADTAETSTGEIDLNCDPNHEDMQVEVLGTSSMNQVQSVQLPLEDYTKQNGLTSLLPEQHCSLNSSGEVPEAACTSDEGRIASLALECESRGDEVFSESNLD